MASALAGRVRTRKPCDVKGKRKGEREGELRGEVVHHLPCYFPNFLQVHNRVLGQLHSALVKTADHKQLADKVNKGRKQKLFGARGGAM